MIALGLWSLITDILVLVCVAFYTLIERKRIASVQRRRGPNVVGFWGLLQPIADAVKLITKEPIIPSKSNKFIFMLAPMLALISSRTNWAIMPFNFQTSEWLDCVCIGALMLSRPVFSFNN